MSIQWFPGHMNQARRQLIDAMRGTDVVLEVVDARLPLSSSNPLLKTIRRQKRCIKLLNKSDLADPKTTQRWLNYFQQQPGITALAINTAHSGQVRRDISERCLALFPGRRLSERPIQALIVGIPNVGKSTLINVLLGRRITKVANEPGVTKMQQKVDLGGGLTLCDTPGILWPKIEEEATGYRLAASGAIAFTAMDLLDVAVYAADFLLAHYPGLLLKRFQLNPLPPSSEALFQAVGKRRGCLIKGGEVDLHKVAEIFLHEVKNGLIGPLSFEWPDEVELHAPPKETVA